MTGKISMPSPLPKPLVLASTSPYRRELLARLRLPFETVSPGVDEDAWKGKGLEPSSLVQELAQAKAEARGEDYPHSLLIGSDQVVEVEGVILGKPGTRDGAVQQLMLLSGKTHRLLTAVAVHDPESRITLTSLDVHQLTMRTLTEASLRRYVELDQPFDCAGAYRMEGLGIALFEAIRGEDATAVIGLPLIRLTGLLARLGRDVL